MQRCCSTVMTWRLSFTYFVVHSIPSQYNRVVSVFTLSDIFAVTVLLALYGPRPSLCIVWRRNRIIYATGQHNLYSQEVRSGSHRLPDHRTKHRTINPMFSLT